MDLALFPFVLLVERFFVSFRVLQAVEFIGVDNLEFEQPAVTVGIGIDQGRIGFEILVDRNHHA